MKKATKTIGAIALSAALALGTAVPAFADPLDENGIANPGGTPPVTAADATEYVEVNATENSLDAQNTGSSKVRVLSRVGQLSATVPVMVYVVANTAGGPLLATPSGDAAEGTAVKFVERAVNGGNVSAVTVADGGSYKWLPDISDSLKNVSVKSYKGYRIENTSDMNLQVTSVRAAVGEDESDLWVYSNTEIKEAADIAKTYTGKRGAINLKLTTAGADSKRKTLSTVAADSTIAAADLAGWVIPHAGEVEKDVWDTAQTGWSGLQKDAPHKTVSTEPGVLGLKISGTTSVISGGEDITYGDGFKGAEYTGSAGDVKIVYTIGIAKGDLAGTNGATE